MTNVRHSTLILTALLTAGCADFATEPDRTPTELRVTPESVLMTEGDTTRFQVEVLDQNGVPFETIPTWSPPFFASSETDRLRFDRDGLATAVGSGATVTEVTLAGLEASASVRVNPRELGLDVSFVHVNQGTQRRSSDVPLIAGRGGLLRVYVEGDALNFFRPSVQATFHDGATVIHTATMELGIDGVPVDVVDGDLTFSYSAEVPASVMVPGLRLVVDVDPDGVVPAAPGSELRVPATGTMDLGVRTVKPFRLTMVPVYLAAYDRGSHLTASGIAEIVTRLTRDVYPISEFDLSVRSTYTTEVLLNTGDGWNDLLYEIAALRLDDGSTDYYYGGFDRPNVTSIGGLGFLGGHPSGQPAAIGMDDNSEVIAHEIGHNFNLPHAPCGGPSGADPAYPYDNGRIGQYGYSNVHKRLMNRERYDLMTYCGPVWISDYNYERVIEYRDTSRYDFATPAAAEVGTEQRTLVVGGGVVDGELRLQPALEWTGPVSMPERGGRYTVEGLDAGGAVLFTVSVDPARLDHGDNAQFIMAVPAEMASLDRLERIRLSGPEGVVEQRRSRAFSQIPEVRVRPAAGSGGAGRTVLSWDARAFPMAIVRDRDTGRIRGMSRTGRLTLPEPDATGLEVVLSDGAATVPARLVQP